MADRVLREKTGRPADQFLTNSARRATVVSVTNKTHSTPTARKVKVLDIDDPRHGSLNGYTNLRCRCDECRAANTAYQLGWSRRMGYKPLAVDAPQHGTLGGYTNYSCRCDECRAANNAQQIDYMRRHPEQREKHRIRQQKRRQALR